MISIKISVNNMWSVSYVQKCERYVVSIKISEKKDWCRCSELKIVNIAFLNGSKTFSNQNAEAALLHGADVKDMLEEPMKVRVQSLQHLEPGRFVQNRMSCQIKSLENLEAIES